MAKYHSCRAFTALMPNYHSCRAFTALMPNYHSCQALSLCFCVDGTKVLAHDSPIGINFNPTDPL